MVNPVSALQGKIAGVQVINSGKAGSDPEIRVRGTNSINGYKPLYVVDGLFNDNINFLNPQDIESMEILKDPSSLAIFGVRGANGVIIITTKKAKEGQTRVNINGSFGFKSVTDKIALTDAEGFKLLYNEQLRNEGTRNTTSRTGRETPTGRMKSSRLGSSPTTTSASRVPRTRTASISVRAMPTNKATSSTRSTARLR